jgi:hypothetical protein
MNTQLHHTTVVAQRSSSPPPRPVPQRQPSLISEAAPVLSIVAAIGGLLALGATTVS